MSTPSTPAPRISSPEAKVKPLEWRAAEFAGQRGTVCAVAVTPFGNYVIEQLLTGQFCLLLTGQALFNLDLGSIAEAKAAAQADFEKRILSSLAPSSPAGEPEAWADDAARKLGWTLSPSFIQEVQAAVEKATGYYATMEVVEHVFLAARATPPAQALPGITEEMVEAAARAMCQAIGGDYDAMTFLKAPVRKQARAALEAASITRPAEREKWRTMESAPKDGARILISSSKYGEVCEAKFENGTWIVATFNGSGGHDDSPIAWMPLPASTDHVGGGE